MQHSRRWSTLWVCLQTNGTEFGVAYGSPYTGFPGTLRYARRFRCLCHIRVSIMWYAGQILLWPWASKLWRYSDYQTRCAFLVPKVSPVQNQIRVSFWVLCRPCTVTYPNGYLSAIEKVAIAILLWLLDLREQSSSKDGTT